MGAYVGWKDDPTIARLRPQAARLFADTNAAVRSAMGAPNQRQMAERDQVQLPFVVIEPRDLDAPLIAGLPRVRVPAPELAMAQPAAQPASPNLPLDLDPVEARLRTKVPNELFGYFDLYLYVSKATPDKGKWAQKMFVLAKQNDQSFKLLYNWPVSTGREEPVQAPSGRTMGTHTPNGIFKLDRGRFYQDYTSRQWQAPMPSAMFFDWQTEGRPSGLAIHGSDADGEKALGQRASHGCIRLSADNARVLFELIQQNYRGRVPMFAVDPVTGTMSTTGKLVRDEKGNIVTRPGYRVLVFIEDFGGPSVDTVAALY